MAEVVVQTRAGLQPNHEFFALAVEFVERYVDGRHHIKEEGALFEALITFGFSSEGPIGCMVHQHQRGRELIHLVRAWVDSDPNSRAQGLEEMLSAATQYIELLWHHIATEDNGIFPAAELALPDELRVAVWTRSEQLDPSPQQEFRRAADVLVSLAERASLESASPSARSTRARHD